MLSALFRAPFGCPQPCAADDATARPNYQPVAGEGSPRRLVGAEDSSLGYQLAAAVHIKSADAKGCFGVAGLVEDQELDGTAIRGVSPPDNFHICPMTPPATSRPGISPRSTKPFASICAHSGPRAEVRMPRIRNSNRASAMSARLTSLAAASADSGEASTQVRCRSLN